MFSRGHHDRVSFSMNRKRPDLEIGRPRPDQIHRLDCARGAHGEIEDLAVHTKRRLMIPVASLAAHNCFFLLGVVGRYPSGIFYTVDFGCS